jgi:CRP-like cAMP-binding protein
MQEMRIAAVARGSGPRGSPHQHDSFDAFLLDMAKQRGAHHVQERVAEVDFVDGRPRVRTSKGAEESFDLLVSAVGVNSSMLKTLESVGTYKRPETTKAYVAEFQLGTELIERYLGDSMHVFLLNLPRLEFACIIPKSDFVTICLLGKEIDRELVDAFLSSNEVREVLPPHWEIPKDYCQCSPRLNADTAIQPYGDRMVFIGDCGTTRLFKDGIGAAYRTSKAAAKTAVFRGISAADFKRGYWPTCRTIHADNRLGKTVFWFTEQIQKRKTARQALWRLTSHEQQRRGDKRRMSMVLWDTFTGSAPYKSVLRRALHPSVVGGLTWELAAARRSGSSIKPKEQFGMATGGTGLSARRFATGTTIYSQGDPSEAMYVIDGGRVDLARLDGDQLRSLGERGPGDFFGEMAVFGEETRPATALAVGDCTIVELERGGLLRRIHEDPGMAFRLIEHMAHRIAELEEALVGIAGESGTIWSEDEARTQDASPSAPEDRFDGTSLGLMGREYSAGDVIYHQGDRGDCMFVIQGGRAEGIRREGAQEHSLGVLQDGDFFGELALFDEEVRTATVRALDDLSVFTLERNSLLQRVHEDPSSAFQLIDNMAGRITRLEAELVRLTRVGAG